MRRWRASTRPCVRSRKKYIYIYVHACVCLSVCLDDDDAWCASRCVAVPARPTAHAVVARGARACLIHVSVPRVGRFCIDAVVDGDSIDRSIDRSSHSIDDVLSTRSMMSFRFDDFLSHTSLPFPPLVFFAVLVIRRVESDRVCPSIGRLGRRSSNGGSEYEGIQSVCVDDAAAASERHGGGLGVGVGVGVGRDAIDRFDRSIGD